jgi:hypothetical protein
MSLVLGGAPAEEEGVPLFDLSRCGSFNSKGNLGCQQILGFFFVKHHSYLCPYLKQAAQRIAERQLIAL